MTAIYRSDIPNAGESGPAAVRESVPSASQNDQALERLQIMMGGAGV